MKSVMSALAMAAVVLMSSTKVFAIQVISEGTIHGPMGSGESLQVLVHDDGSIKLEHRQGDVRSQVSGFPGLRQTTVIWLEKTAEQRNVVRFSMALPASLCAAVLVGYVGTHMGVAMDTISGSSTLAIATYVYGPAAAMVGAVTGFTTPLLVTADRKKQLLAIRALAKVSMTVVNAEVTSPMPIQELIGQLILLGEVAKK